MKNLRPPQDWAYYNAAMVAYHEGNMKRGDYYFLIYCAKSSQWQETHAIREKTPRQKEQEELFRKAGMISRELANIKTLQSMVHFETTKQELGTVAMWLRCEYSVVQAQMKTIKERIPS